MCRLSTKHMANAIEVLLRARHMPTRRSRLPYIETASRPALSKDERAAFEVFAREIRADLDMDLDPRYRMLLDQIRTRIKGRALRDALYHPERLLESGARYPLYSSEIAELARRLGVETTAKTVDRLVVAGLVPRPATIGTGKLVRSAFFARHLVDVLFEQVFAPKPEVMLAHIAILRGEVSRAMRVFYQGLEGVRPGLIDALGPVTPEGPKEPTTLAYEKVAVGPGGRELTTSARRR